MTAPRDDNYSPPAALLDGRGGARLLDRKALERWRPEDGPLWVALDEDSERDRTWLETESGLGKDNRDLFLRKGAWPRIRILGTEQLFLLMRVPDADPDAHPDAFALLRFWIEPKRVITMSPRALPHMQRVKGWLETGQGPTSVGGLLMSVAEFVADQLADWVLDLRLAVADIDLAVEEKRPSSLEQVQRLRRRIIRLQRYAGPQRAMLLHARSLDLTWLMKDDADDWHAVIQYYQEGSQELDAIDDHVRVLEDALANRTSEEINRRIYLLTLLSTLFLPLSLVTGLFAASVGTVDGNILGAQHPLWFVALCIALVVVALGVYILLRRRFL